MGPLPRPGRGSRKNGSPDALLDALTGGRVLLHPGLKIDTVRLRGPRVHVACSPARSEPLTDIHGRRLDVVIGEVLRVRLARSRQARLLRTADSRSRRRWEARLDQSVWPTPNAEREGYAGTAERDPAGTGTAERDRGKDRGTGPGGNANRRAGPAGAQRTWCSPKSNRPRSIDRTQPLHQRVATPRFSATARPPSGPAGRSWSAPSTIMSTRSL